MLKNLLDPVEKQVYSVYQLVYAINSGYIRPSLQMSPCQLTADNLLKHIEACLLLASADAECQLNCSSLLSTICMTVYFSGAWHDIKWLFSGSYDITWYEMIYFSGVNDMKWFSFQVYMTLYDMISFQVYMRWYLIASGLCISTIIVHIRLI